ncbi:hypothetical protein ACFQ1M_15850 [Sungkyunkwania multivorans]|uniref:Long-subunit fatty acid transport protein n=1 Tax=Sungkyunkwania multivorans TaxID=1173618 RepID=A0ABW3D4A3_9FLAO
MIKRFFLVIAICITTNAFSQEGTASPYSFNGIGELKFKGTEENRMMGGLGIYADSIHLNINNPASLGKLQLTTYTIGLNYNSVKLENASASENAETASVDYLALGFPVTKKLGVSFGLLPFTSVGYRLRNDTIGTEINDDGEPEEVILQRDTFEGSGGVNKVFLSAGYAITEELSLGFSMNYNFGAIDNSNVRSIRNLDRFTQDAYNSDLSGFDFRFSANYQKTLKNNFFIVSNLGYTPSADLTSKNSRTLTTGPALGTFGTVDVQVVELGANKETDLTLPANFSLGAGFGKQYKWFVGAEFTSIKTGDFQDRFFVPSNNVIYEDASRLSLGGFYIPKYNSFSSYWQRVVYRAGLRFEGTGINVRGEAVNDFGMSFGVGLPMRNFSNVNLGFEFGKRGTTNSGLVKENYVNFRLSLSLNDKWFQKRKYN